MSEPTTPKPPASMSEEQFLLQQAEAAKEAITAAWKQVTDDLKHGADVRLWAKQYPLAVAGGALVAGFLAASAMIPSKEEQALKKLGKIQAAMGAAPVAVDGAAKPKKQSSFVTTLTREIFNTLRPAVLSALTAGVAAHQAGNGEEESEAAEAGGSYSASEAQHETPYAGRSPLDNAAEI